MSVKIRLQLTGKRNSRSFRIVAVDESKKRDGAVLENVGSFNPRDKKTGSLNKDRIAHWVKNGAIVTPAVQKLLQEK